MSETRQDAAPESATSPVQLNGLRWIAFDAVGTLIFADPPVHLAYHRIGRKHGSQLGPAEVKRRFEGAFRRASCTGAEASVPEHSAGSISPPTPEAEEAAEREYWHAIFRESLPDVAASAECFDELFEHFALPQSWGCFADVEETFELLRQQGYRLAIASNFDRRLHAVCNGHAGLRDIERRVISSEIGSRKPSRSFYAAVLRACGCEPLIVGDDVEHDVRAPAKLGIQSLHLDRSGSGIDAIASLAELPGWLAGRSG